MPTSLNQVLVLLVFIIPGFILMRVKRVAYPTVEASATSTVLDSLSLSCVIYALASPVLANGRIYCRNAQGMLICLDVRAPK